MTNDNLAFSFAYDKKTVLKMLQILYNCFKNDIKQCKKDFKNLTRQQYEELLSEKFDYENHYKMSHDIIDDEDFYISANLKFIEDCFYFKRCSKCNSLLNAVAIYSV